MIDMSLKIMQMMNEFRALIEERRKELNITKSMIYENTGYGRHPYNSFVNEGCDIGLSNFIRLCDYLHIRIKVDVDGSIKPYKERPKGKLSHKNYVPKPKPVIIEDEESPDETEL